MKKAKLILKSSDSIVGSVLCYPCQLEGNSDIVVIDNEKIMDKVKKRLLSEAIISTRDLITNNIYWINLN